MVAGGHREGSMSVLIPETSALTEEQIAIAEEQLGCRLPTSYRAFVRRHDGAKPEDNIFDVPGNQSSVRRFVPLLNAAALRGQIEGFPANGVPIAEDDCGNYVWLTADTAAIFFWDHEIDAPSARIADDFDQFLASLQPFDPASVRLAPGQVRRAWINPDFKPKFD
jgi:hypothetical protein